VTDATVSPIIGSRSPPVATTMPRRDKSDVKTPTDGGTPTDVSTPPRLPRPPSVGSPRPPRLPHLPTARPGRRGEAPSDVSVTARLDRIMVEPTPAPLPPAPAAADVERWFEQVPTNPGAPADTPAAAAEPSAPPAGPGERGLPPWLLPVLLALTALAVGMVLGALLFEHAPERSHCPPCDQAAPR